MTQRRNLTLEARNDEVRNGGGGGEQRNKLYDTGRSPFSTSEEADERQIESDQGPSIENIRD